MKSKLTNLGLILLTIGTVILFWTTPTNAFEPNKDFGINHKNEEFLSRNKILFYDPNKTGFGDCSDQLASGNLVLQGDDNEEKIFIFLTSNAFKHNNNKPLSQTQAAAIIGNFYKESALDPKAINPSSGATGIAQWLGGRLENLKKFSKEKSGNDSEESFYNLEMQLGFLKQELDSTEKKVLSDSDFLSNDIEKATLAFRKIFERPGEDEADDKTRAEKAKSSLEKFKDKTPKTNYSSNCTTTPTKFSGDGFKIYMQTDPRWSSLPYSRCDVNGIPGKQTMYSHGCGVAAMTTILNNLNISVSIQDIIKMARSSGAEACDGGTNGYTLTKSVSEKYKLKYDFLSGIIKDPPPHQKNFYPEVVKSSIEKALKDGRLVYISGTRELQKKDDHFQSPFTSSGHFIVIRGINKNGKWLIAQVYGPLKYSNNPEDEWDPDFLLGKTIRIGTLASIGLE